MSQIKNLQLRIDVLLAFQVAILGIVTPNIRGITVKYDNHRIDGLFLFDRPLNSADTDRVSEVESELCAHFPMHEVEMCAKCCTESDDLNAEILADWVYRRYED